MIQKLTHTKASNAMDNRESVADKFRIVLCRRLKNRFGKIISAQRFADQFNLNAHGTTPVSRETARRWIRGDAIPDYGHLAALIRWLDIDPDDFLGDYCHAEVGKKLQSEQAAQRAPSETATNILRLLDALDKDTQRTILAIAEILVRNADAAKETEYNSDTNTAFRYRHSEQSTTSKAMKTAQAHHELHNNTAASERFLFQRL